MCALGGGNVQELLLGSLDIFLNVNALFEDYVAILNDSLQLSMWSVAITITYLNSLLYK